MAKHQHGREQLCKRYKKRVFEFVAQVSVY